MAAEVIPVRFDCGSRACPGCHATGTDADGMAPCRVCLGTLWHPYPWDLPEDADLPAPSEWSAEEAAIVTAAPSHLTAYIGYCAVYGPSVRTYRSIVEYRKRHSAGEAGHRPAWSSAALVALEDAPSAAAAVTAVRSVWPTVPVTDEAIERRWYRLHQRLDGTPRTF